MPRWLLPAAARRSRVGRAPHARLRTRPETWSRVALKRLDRRPLHPPAPAVAAGDLCPALALAEEPEDGAGLRLEVRGAGGRGFEANGRVAAGDDHRPCRELDAHQLVAGRAREDDQGYGGDRGGTRRG